MRFVIALSGAFNLVKSGIRQRYPFAFRKLQFLKGFILYDLPASVIAISRYGLAPRGRVRLSPGRVYPEETMSILFRANRYRIVPANDRRRDVIEFFRPDTTYGGVAPLNSINGLWTNRSKSELDRYHGEIMGYSLSVNPKLYEGLAVAKSEINGANDGEVIRLPHKTHPRHGTVYQRLIENRNQEGFYVDIRVPVIFGHVSWARIETKAPAHQFSGIARHAVSVVPAESVLSLKEQKALVQLSRAIGMDCGEFDVLRDRSDGRIYVVDANEPFWFDVQPKRPIWETWSVYLDFADAINTHLAKAENYDSMRSHNNRSAK